MSDLGTQPQILDYFRNHNPFDTNEKLMCINLALIDENNCVNCYQAEEVGAKIQKQVDGKSFGNVSFKRKEMVDNPQSLYSTINVHGEKIDINLIALFLRLITVVDRQPEKEIDNYFFYELSTYPISLMKDNMMRPATKWKLKEFVLKDISPSDTAASDSRISVLDGGALVWSHNQKKGEKFREIFKKYSERCKKLHVNVVVFDGYVEFTKTQTRRTKTESQSVQNK